MNTDDETRLPTDPRQRVAVELMGIYAPYLPVDYSLSQWLADADAVLAASSVPARGGSVDRPGGSLVREIVRQYVGARSELRDRLICTVARMPWESWSRLSEPSREAIRQGLGKWADDLLDYLTASLGAAVCHGGEEPTELHTRYCVPLMEALNGPAS